MHQTLNDLRFEFFLENGARATQTQATIARAMDPREVSPGTADGLVWLVKLWWHQRVARRAQTTVPILEQAAERGFHRLTGGL